MCLNLIVLTMRRIQSEVPMQLFCRHLTLLAITEFESTQLVDSLLVKVRSTYNRFSFMIIVEEEDSQKLQALEPTMVGLSHLSNTNALNLVLLYVGECIQVFLA